ncbi:MAG: DUF3990 domain-containing protein [Planctomycetaceae bacterium]|jgi:hypothetical protein|nr:DUF3990 domain-containing protein [Planctomycetaceae bacterium]
MIVYHGSYIEIDVIDLSQCEPHKDFGQGFYVTKYKKHAETWAARIGEKHETKGVVTEFNFHESAFTNNKYKVLRFADYSDDWLDFVVNNRNNESPVPSHDYDIVEGYVANDRIQRRIDDYLAGIIDREKFLKELVYHEPTHQICFCTVKSLQMLEKAARHEISNIEDIADAVIVALVTEQSKTEAEAIDIFYKSVTFAKLTEKNSSLLSLTWREIYNLFLQELENRTCCEHPACKSS